MAPLETSSTPKVSDSVDFRGRARAGLALAGLVLLAPFSLNNFIQGRWVLGVGSLIIVASLALEQWGARRGREMSAWLHWVLIPTLVFFLARVGAVTARFLIRNTKYAILIIFIIAAVLTPTGDPVTLTLMAGPMVALYGLSILIAFLVAPRRSGAEDRHSAD